MFLGVELQDLGGDFLASRHHFAWVTDAAPSHVGDVQQAIDAAQIDECTVLGDGLDHAMDAGSYTHLTLPTTDPV